MAEMAQLAAARPRRDGEFEVLRILCDRGAPVELLAIVSCASLRAWRRVRLLVRASLAQLLPPLVRRAAGVHGSPGYARCAAAARWLAITAGPGPVAALAGVLVGTPRVPPDLAAALCDAGVSITAAQLAYAVAARVPGVESWVVSHRSGLPALTEAICSTRRPELGFSAAELKALLPRLQPDELADAAALAFNALSPTAAGVLLAHLESPAAQLAQLDARHAQALRDAPAQRRRGVLVAHRGQLRVPPLVKALREEQVQERAELVARHAALRAALTPALLERLLLSAAERGHGRLLLQLCALPEAAEVSVGAAAPLLEAAVSRADVGALAGLAATKAAKALPVSAVASLLRQAVQRGFSSGAAVLVGLPAAAAIAGGEAAALLRLATQQQDRATVASLHALRGAADVSSQSVGELLRAALQQQDAGTAGALATLLAAQLIPPGQLGSIVALGLRSRLAASTSALLELQGAQQLDPGTLAGLMETAIECAAQSSCVTKLASLPAAAAVPPARLSGLLAAALAAGERNNSFATFAQMLRLQGAASVEPESLLGLLTRALRRAGPTACQEICDAPVAAQLPAASVASLLRDALRLGRATAAECVVGLPGVAQLGVADVQALLRLSARGVGVMAVTSTLCGLPASDLIPTAVVAELLQSAISRASCSGVEVLAALPGAEEMLPEELAPLLLQEVISQSECDCVLARLCALSCGDNLPASTIAELLRAALSHGNGPAAVQLCELPAADDMSPAEVLAALEAALALDDVTEAQAGGLGGLATHKPLAAVEELLGLQGAWDLESEAIAGLAASALQLGKTSLLLQVLATPPGRRIAGGELARLLELAVAGGRDAGLVALCWLPAAEAALDAETMTRLITVAIQANCSRDVLLRVLGLQAPGYRGLLGAAALSGEAIAELLEAAVIKRASSYSSYWHSVPALCQLAAAPGVAAIPADCVTRMLRTAVRLGSSCLADLAALPAARALPPAAARELVEHAWALGAPPRVTQPLAGLLASAHEAAAAEQLQPQA
ncbi:hypothetical protein HT031_003857 [Scenedesmus sp. PABB004]|nr:hypothetical protein HT031_003857 [Scenedesmus sp. PABB004]